MLQGHAIGVAVPVVIPNPEVPKKAAEEPSSSQRSKFTLAPALISTESLRRVAVVHTNRICPPQPVLGTHCFITQGWAEIVNFDNNRLRSCR